MTYKSNTLDVFRMARDISTRFHYFVTGGAGAILTVMVKQGSPDGVGATFLYRTALISLTVAVAGGLAHLNGERVRLELQVERHDAYDEIFQLDERLATLAKGGVIRERFTTERLTKDEAEKRVKEKRELVADNEKREKQLEWPTVASVMIRNIGLMVGFGCMVLYRFLEP